MEWPCSRRKSCPECSVRDGVQHVFWPYPESLGVSQARVSGEDAEGAQSHCSGCRSRGANYGNDRRSCGQFEGMLEARSESVVVPATGYRDEERLTEFFLHGRATLTFKQGELTNAARLPSRQAVAAGREGFQRGRRAVGSIVQSESRVGCSMDCHDRRNRAHGSGYRRPLCADERHAHRAQRIDFHHRAHGGQQPVRSNPACRMSLIDSCSRSSSPT